MLLQTSLALQFQCWEIRSYDQPDLDFFNVFARLFFLFQIPVESEVKIFSFISPSPLPENSTILNFII